MDNFVVSARKYRPRVFEEVVGQEGVTETLLNAINSNRLPHSMLFCGPRGVGKTTCARILARVINGFEADGDNTTNSLNIFELDAASNNSVDDIRSLMDQVRVPPQHGKYKVYIIDEVHMLSQAAFNAFLKTLEEPPSYAIFILATTEKHKIIPTILSRCQIFDFKRIPVSEIMGHLQNISDQEGITTEQNALHLIGEKADGALRDALSMYDRLVDHNSKSLTFQSVIRNLNVLDYEYYFKANNFFLEQDVPSIMLLFDNILSNGFDGDEFLGGLLGHWRNLMVCKDEKTAGLLEVSGELRERYLEQAKAMDVAFLLNAMNVANQYLGGYKTSKNKRLHVELALMKIAHLPFLAQLEPASSEKKTPVSSVKPVEVVEKEAITIKSEPEPAKVSTPITKSDTSVEAAPEEGLAIKEPIAPITSFSANNTALGDLGPSFTDISKPAAKAVEAEVEVLEEEVASNVILDEAAFSVAWKDFYTNQAPGSAQDVLKMALLSYQPGQATITVGNDRRLNIVNDIKDALQQHLKNALQLEQLKLVSVIDKSLNKPTTTKPFTAEEKLKHLANKNPAVISLKERLDLRIKH